MSTATTEQNCTPRTQQAIDDLAKEIVSNGYEMLGDEVYSEPLWLSLVDVATAVGATVAKPRFEHGPVKDGKVECPLAGDFWDVLTEDGVTWCDGCTQELPAPAAAPAPAQEVQEPAAVPAAPGEPIEVEVIWHERGSYSSREEVDVEDFMHMLRGESPYAGVPNDPKGIFTDLAGAGTLADYEARIREAMVDESRQGGLALLLESYFTDNLPDSSSSFTKTFDSSNAVDAIRLTD